MDITIVGPGAVGTLFGGLLAHAGNNVTLVGRTLDHLPAAERGVRVVLGDRWLRFQPLRCLALPRGGATQAGGTAADSAASTAAGSTADLVVVALRRDQLKELRRNPAGGILPGGASNVPGAAAGVPVLYLNSDDPEAGNPGALSGGAGSGRRSLRGLTLWISVRLQPDTVELASARPVFIVEKEPRLKALCASLRSFGIEVVETASLEPFAQSFFLWQLLFLPVAMCHSTYDHFLSYAEGQEIAAGVIEEGLRTLQRSGTELARLPVMDPRELANGVRKGRRGQAAARFAPERGYNSLLQSILRGEKTEVRELNERLVKRAAEAGLEAPWNWRLARKLSRVVQVGFYRDPAALYQALS